MFCCSGDEDTRKTRQIEKKLKDDARQERNKVKLLLLGAGESGKSTLFKQMKILYGVPPSTEDRAEYTQTIHTNTVDNMQKVLAQMDEWGLTEECGCKDAVVAVQKVDVGTVRVGPALGQAIKACWQDPVVQRVWERRNEFQVIESVKVFFEGIDRISADDYLPTAQDHLYTRVRTSGVVQSTFLINGVNFEMYDVGGQRNERRKWMHFFSDVTAIIFVAALSEYDQVLFEDNVTNRMEEALILFEEICKNAVFKDSSFILFLNKSDLFEEKLPNHPIQEVSQWSDYEGGANPEKGMEYFLAQFDKRKGEPLRTIYPHYTNATNTSNVELVFDACRDIILSRNMADNGF